MTLSSNIVASVPIPSSEVRDQVTTRAGEFKVASPTAVDSAITPLTWADIFSHCQDHNSSLSNAELEVVERGFVPLTDEELFLAELAAQKAEQRGHSMKAVDRLVPRQQDHGPDTIPDSGDEPIDLSFEYAEHRHLGDTLILPGFDTQGPHKTAAENPLTLTGNGLVLSYGEINGLAGDFFGTSNPISNGDTPQKRQDLFRDACATLTENTAYKTGVASLKSILGDEVNYLAEALKYSRQPISKGYKTADWSKFETSTMFTFGSGIPSFLTLAAMNMDHFGHDARLSYDAGHAAAMQHAVKGFKGTGKEGDYDVLQEAYIMNAFADHFLQDSFAAGHLRTPRRKLFGGEWNPAISYCSKYMHDEDNHLGLHVTTPTRSVYWVCYGDKKLLDPEAADNFAQCQKALKESVNELYAAWSTGNVATVHMAWSHAPDLEALDSDEFKLKNHSPLFDRDGWVRKELKNRKDYSHKSFFSGVTMLAELKLNAGFFAGE